MTLWRRYEFETLNPRAIGWLGRPVHRPSLVGEDGAKDLVDVEELADGCSGFNLFLEEGLGLLQVLSRLQDGGGVFARNDHNSVAVHDNDVAGRYWNSSALDGCSNLETFERPASTNRNSRAAFQRGCCS